MSKYQYEVIAECGHLQLTAGYYVNEFNIPASSPSMISWEEMETSPSSTIEEEKEYYVNACRELAQDVHNQSNLLSDSEMAALIVDGTALLTHQHFMNLLSICKLYR